MMKLSLMEQVVNTVDQDWRSSFAEEILKHWEYDEGSVYYFRASANFVFLFSNKGKRYFLRFNHASERDIDILQAEIDLLHYLSKSGIDVALPVESLNQNYIEAVETSFGLFYAIVFEGLKGTQYDTEDLSIEQFLEWGKALGKLHHASLNIPNELKQGRKTWRHHLEFIEENLSGQEKAAIHELEVLKKWLSDLEQTEGNYGIIHYDFELDNLVWNDNTIYSLDYDDSVNHWYVADIAYALRDFFEEKVDLQNEKVKEFLKGYQEEHVLETEKLEQELSLFIRLHQLLSFVKLQRTVDIDMSVEHPEWMVNLREKLLGKIEVYRSSFEKYFHQQ